MTDTENTATQSATVASAPAPVQGRDPRTGQPVGEPVPATGARDLARAVTLAAAAFEPWRDSGRHARADALDAVAAALDAHAGELAALAETETALGLVRLTGEVARTSGQLRLFSSVLRDGSYQGVVIERGAPSATGPGRPDLRRIKHPLGPVAVFAASNFPFAFSVAGGDTASALAAGCSVVVKTHEAHPRTSLRTAEIVTAALAAAGAPTGVFSAVFGFEAGGALVKHPAISAVGFTGSTRGGLALAKICAERPVPIPFYGELGSVNPVFVLPGAAKSRPEQIAAGYAASLTQGVGQFCTNPGLIFVPDDTVLLDAITRAVEASTGGPMLADRIHTALESGIEELEELAETTAKSTGNPAADASSPNAANGAHGAPAAQHLPLRRLAQGKPGEGPWSATPAAYTVDAQTFLDHATALREERFGPFGLVVTYTFGSGPDPLNLLDLGALGEGHLTATIHLDADDPADGAVAANLARRLPRIAGRIVFNGWPTGVAVTHAQHHGGPFPATTAPAHTSVGAEAIQRWLIPVVYQDSPSALLPVELRDVA